MICCGWAWVQKISACLGAGRGSGGVLGAMGDVCKERSGRIVADQEKNQGDLQKLGDLQK